MSAAETPQVPEVGWEQFWQERDGLQPGQHVGVIGPTGSGKSYALTWFCENFPGHSILVVTKGSDDLIHRLVSERGWTVARDPDDIFTPDGKPGKLLKRTSSDWWNKRDRPLQRIVYWPQPPTRSVRGRIPYLQASLEELFDRAYEYCRRQASNRILVAVDETMFAGKELQLNDLFTVIWNEGRSMGLSLAAAMQRKAWVSKTAESAPTYILVFDTYSPDDLADLAKLGRFKRSADLAAQLDDLPEHHHLLVVTRGRGRQVYRSRVVIRQRSGGGRNEDDAK